MGLVHWKLVAILLLTGCVAAVPFYSNNFDVDTEFVPLEQHTPQQQQPRTGEKPFDVDVVTSEVNGHSPGVFFQQSFPFFGNDFFNSFGGFGIGAGPREEPWWKGPNVCTEKDEEEKATETKENNKEIEMTEVAPGITENVEVRPPLFGQFHFSVNSCVEKPNKYICTRVVNENGKRKTLTIIRQCCYGYGRPRNADYATPCEKIEIKSIEATAMDMDANEFVANAKNNGLADLFINRKNLTIFMPINSAFTSYKEQLQNENNVVDSKADNIMRSLYLRHLVNGEINLDDVVNEHVLKSQQEGQTIRINAYQLPVSLEKEPFRYTANCVPIQKHDKLSEQGIVHTLSSVLRPVNKTVMDMIRDRRDMSIMRTVLEKTKLSELLEGTKPITIFVPTDDAFDKLEPHFRRALKEGKGCATNILKNHILDLTFCSVASMPGARTTAYNLLGEPMRFNRSKSESDKSEVSDLVGDLPVIINRKAKIIEADLMGSNGVLHVIDTILPTESALPLTSLLEEKNVTKFKRLIEAAGLDEQFDAMDNVTLFAPIDKALESTKWVQMLRESPEKLKGNTELIEFIKYHFVTPMTKTCDLSERLMPTLSGNNVRVNLYSTHALFTNVMNRATVNCARLVHFDDESCGSVLHQVDKPLVAPKMNLLQVLESNPNYSEFLSIVRSANLTSLLANNEDSYTLLVPKNDVFGEVEDWKKSLTKDESQLENLIKTHIVNDVVCCAGIIPTNWPFVRSIEAVNGVRLRITRDRRPKIENAGVTKCDSVTVNGIIHEINDVIVPSQRPQRPQQQTFQSQAGQFGDLFF